MVIIMAGKVKIRIVSNCSIVITIILAALCIIISLFGLQKYAVLCNATQEYISCEKAVKQLQTGSDNLTKQVRLAAMTGEQEYIDAYFEEANVTKSRENAIESLTQIESNSEAISALQDALADSVHLMQTEYYAMRLVEEAIDADPSTWSKELQAVILSSEDEALSKENKLSRAQSLVVSINYENAKEEISSEVDASLNTLMQEIWDKQHVAAVIFSHVYRNLIVCVIIFAVIMLLTGLIMLFWIAKPLLHYNESIKHGTIFPIHGANELQVLAETYNKIYQENEERELLMKRQAEHDPLTELLNRGSFDRILNLYESDHNNFALILVDIDTFKSVNDTYGHATGDLILKKVATLLRSAFRTIDYVCRIGGDEFAIIMVDMTSNLSYTITDKINDVNRQLANPDPEEGVPAVSLSAGIAFTDRDNPGNSLFKDADHALYYTKEHGRNGCTFY